MSWATGERLGPYEIDALIGRGSMDEGGEAIAAWERAHALAPWLAVTNGWLAAAYQCNWTWQPTGTNG